MTEVARLVTWVDVIEDGDPSQMSVSARLEAELVDGRRIVLLDDRGWSGTGGWAGTSVEEIEETARVVVGPDEAFDDLSQEQMDASHWASLCEALRREGAIADPDELRRLQHDVVLSNQVSTPGDPAAE